MSENSGHTEYHYFISSPTPDIRMVYNLTFRFPDEEAQAQKGPVTCPRPHSQQGAELESITWSACLWGLLGIQRKAVLGPRLLQGGVWGRWKLVCVPFRARWLGRVGSGTHESPYTAGLLEAKDWACAPRRPEPSQVHLLTSCPVLTLSWTDAVTQDVSGSLDCVPLYL